MDVVVIHEFKDISFVLLEAWKMFKKRGTVMVNYHWGVDSSQRVTEELYNCVLENYGKPEFWGRYLTRVQGASEGLTKDEIELLHNSGTKLMPIYNNFRSAVGENEGQVVGMYAAHHAKRLGIRKGTPIFANVEKFFHVDSAWIRGYVDYLYTTDYKPGFFHNPIEGDFPVAFCDAISKSNRVADQAILWSAKPEPGVTKMRLAPQFKPTSVPCKANVLVWQYGRDAKNCPINTDLIDSGLFEILH